MLIKLLRKATDGPNKQRRWNRLKYVFDMQKHKILPLQDLFATLYNHALAHEEGSLFHTKNRFMHRNLSGEVYRCMNHTVELVGSFTDECILGTALQHMGIQDCVSQTDDLPSESHELHQYKQSVLEHFTTLAFHPPNLEQVLVTEMEEKDGCYGRESDERMIQCSSESRCAGRLWYHLLCINMCKVPQGKWLCQNCTTEESVDEKLENTKMDLWMDINDRIRYRAPCSNNGGIDH